MENSTLNIFKNLFLSGRVFKCIYPLKKGILSKAFHVLLLMVFPLSHYATVSSTIKKDFNATAIPGGSYIWFSAIVTIDKYNTTPVTVAFTEQSITSAAFTLYPPDGSVTINSNGTAATTSSNGTLLTVIPNGTAGNYFISGLMFQVPGGGYAGSLQDVTWSGLISISRPGIVVDWKWSAAVYTSFTNDYNALGIKPCDDAAASIYLNNDKSGTPENYKAFVIPGATGGGGTNYTGSYTSWAPTIRTIINPPGMQLSESDALCYGSSSGSVTSSIVGGCAPLSYSWSNGSTTANLLNIGAGSYNVTVTDFVGLKDSATIYVDEPPELVSQISSQTHVSCNGGSNGSATVSATGGTGSYTYLWNTIPAKTTATANGLSAGNYSVTVTDILGCAKISSVTIQQPALLNSDILYQTDVSCFGLSDGFASLSVSGGTTPYSYLWNTSPVKTTYGVTGLAAGTYLVTVTDFKGCIDSNTIIISQPDSLTASTFADTVAGGFNVSGCGSNDGSIDLTVNGGTGPYGFQWNNSANTEDLSSIGPGEYNVLVSDANGCTVEAFQELNQPGLFEASSVISPVVNGGYNIACKGNTNGTIDVSLSGGATPYSYIWSNGATTEDLNNVGAGIYSITVTDGNGCTTISSAIVTEPDSLTPTPEVATFYGGYNISCNGSSNGSIDLSVGGGTSPFTFLWNTGATTEDLSNLAAGIYSVTITDNNGCTNTFSDTLTQPASFSSAANAAVVAGGNITCFGAANGSINLSISGGTAPLDFQWSNGANTQDINNLAAGTYSVTVTDANGCVANANSTLTQPAMLNAGTSAPAVLGGYNIACNGTSTGSINLTMSGGTTPYSFAWNNGSTTEDLANIPAGNYSITATDVNGCVAHATATLTQPNPFVSGTSSPSYNGGYNISCAGLSNGAVNLSVSGGTLPYTFNWNNGATAEDISNLAAGTYSATITDANGCSTSSSIILSQPAVLAPDTDVSKVNGDYNVSCYGMSDGNINLSVFGGTEPYSFTWNSGDTTEDLNGIPAGTYSVTVSDANNCITNANAILTQPDSLTSAIIADTLNGGFHVSGCNGNDGSVNLTVAGGTSPHTFLWNTGATTEDLYGLPAGTYNVIVSDDNGCTSNASVVLNQPNLFATTASSPQVNGGYNISCFGNNDGSVQLNVNGGASPYSYQWSNGDTIEDITDAGAGIYSVTVTDANGCTSVSSIVLSQPGILASNAALSSFNGGYNISCNGFADGAINLSVSGGTTPYSYNWTNGAVTQDLSSLAAGNYTVTITDANGCTTARSISLAQPEILSSSISSDTVNGGYNISCNGASDGAIKLVISGGTAPYSFLWNNGSISEDLINVASGNYSVTVTDGNSCLANTTIALTQPLNLATTSASAFFNGGYNISCNGLSDGSVNLTVSGGTGPYAFLWSNGSSTEDLNAIQAGNYSVTVTDANGCVTNHNTILTQPAGLGSAATSATLNGGYQISCNGFSDGSVDLTVTGGTQPYTYIWSNGAATEDISNLPSGNYSVTITDANACTSAASVSLTQPDVLSSSATPDVVNGAYNVRCKGANDGSIDLSTSGGTQPYSYLWSNGATSEDIDDLAAGNYTVTITDANNCFLNVVSSLTEPDSLISPATAASFNGGYNISCYSMQDGYINLSPSGGTAPYSFLWNNDEITEDLSNLSAGTYNVTVTDANGCISNATVMLTQPDALESFLSSPSVNGGYNISCSGATDGSVSLSVNGGTEPYSFTWSNGQTTEDLSGLGAGSYDVTITDANACTISPSVNLTQPPPLTSLYSLSSVNGGYNITCNGASTGSIDLAVNGGTQPYTYLWSNGDTIQDISGLSAGSYFVTVADNNGCESTQTIILTEPSALETSMDISEVNGNFNIRCHGMSDGSIDLLVSGGATPYTYAWSNGDTIQDLSNIAAGNYSVSISDANNCNTIVSALLVQPDTILSVITSDTLNGGFHVSGCNGSEGAIDLNVTGGTIPYTYQWSNGDTVQDIDSLIAGTYSVIITDLNGCVNNSSITLTQPNSFTVISVAPQVNGGYNISCEGASDGAINLFVSGGSSPYSYLWSNGETTKDIAGIKSGIYSVTITDANGCTSVSSQVLLQPEILSSSPYAPVLNGGYHISCYGLSNGSLDVVVSGGTAPYLFEWNNGDTANSLSSLAAGLYIVTITDANNCAVVDSFTLKQPDSVAVLTSIPAVNGGYNIPCYGNAFGSVDITVIGGSFPYSFLWTNGEQTEDIDSLLAGIYSVTVTDDNGCEFSSTATLTQPDSLSSTSFSPLVNGGYNLACNGAVNGSVNLTVNGGTPPFSFLWSNGETSEDISGLSAGNYSVSVFDGNGCSVSSTVTITQPDSLVSSADLSAGPGEFNISCYGVSDGFIDVSVSGGTLPHSFLWNNGETSEDLVEIPAGNYSVTITDANGCNISANAILTQPPFFDYGSVVSLVNGGYNISCNGVEDGSIDLTSSGGAQPFTFIWNSGQTTEDLQDLGPGLYSVTITDANDCELYKSFTLVEPPAFSASTIDHNVADVKCSGGSDGYINIRPTGGTSPYSYLWNNGETSEDLDSLPASGFSVSISDANNCKAELALNVEQPDPMQFETVIKNMTCTERIDGAINLSINGGIAPYTYSWNNGSGTNELKELQAGTYTATVTDYNGCSLEAKAEVLDPGNSLCFLEIPNGYSPNNDGMNDYFVVNGIEFRRENKLVIYNRWGNEVYQKENYFNEWNGTTNNNEELPDGTYFCVLIIENEKENTVLKGFVDIRR